MVTLKTLFSLNEPSEFTPGSGVTLDAAGDLIGTAEDEYGDDTVYEIANTSTGYANTPTTLVTFNYADGSDASSALIADSAGDLLGATESGGANGYGAVFEIANTSTGYASAPTVLVSFNGTDGDLPVGGLIADAAGNLFGTTYYSDGVAGYGTVFEIVNTSTGYASTPTTLATFDVANGEYPSAGLVADAAGDLFGTTQYGGVNGDGTVYELVNNSGSYALTTLVTFDGINGAGSQSGLTADAAGDLFGTTNSGGVYGLGTVYELIKNGDGYKFETLVNFNGTNGAFPLTVLLVDAAGDLFGTTAGGGDSNGTVFEIAKTAGSYASTPTTLYSFDGTNGSEPIGKLSADANGDLLGVTSGGGANGDGTVYELTNTGFVVCYLAGTRIATPKGEMAVEQLMIGDAVMTLGGQARPIVWIGQGRALSTRGRRNAATPVIVRKNALADNVPNRDLRITKAHSLYIDDVLIPVEFLINHCSILWDDHAQEVDLYHIELETHDVLLANGAPAESYRDDGNRWLFQNVNSGWGLPAQEPYAPVLTGGAIVDTVWRRLLDRTGKRPGLPVTDDPDLHLLVDGKRVDAVSHTETAHIFRLAARPGVVRIVSRAGSPCELGLARDPRMLGVALEQIVVRQGTRFRATTSADPLLAEGFHTYEPSNRMCWTDGDARLPAALFKGFDGPIALVLHVGGIAQYPLTGEVQARPAA